MGIGGILLFPLLRTSTIIQLLGVGSVSGFKYDLSLPCQDGTRQCRGSISLAFADTMEAFDLKSTPTSDHDHDFSKVAGVISVHEANIFLGESKDFRKSKSKDEKEVLASFQASLDLGKTEEEVLVLPKGVGIRHHDEPVLLATWKELDKIVQKAKKGHYACYQLYNDGGCEPWKISAMSKTTGNPAMLCAPLTGSGAPTMVLGGFTMHRITGDDRKKTSMGPQEDTKNKIKAAGFKKVYGSVLDTCLGLGYTAIAAAECANINKVTTIELDDVSIEMCRNNPWSQDIFQNEKINLIHGDACEVIKSFPANHFSGIIHDPPARALCKASDMYGQAFYDDLWRVLRPGATLFHYIGNPASKESGRLFKGVIDRLYKSGFQQVSTDKQAFGVTAKKS